MIRAGSAVRYPSHVALPVAVLALAGMVDLLFERIVYRIGIHVPKDDSVLSAYRGATTVGDSAFRYTVVLAVFAAGAVAIHLLRRPSIEQRAAGAGLAALAILDTLSIRSDGYALGLMVSATYAGALALLLGMAAGGRRAWPMRLASLTAGAALLAGQYPLIVARVGEMWQLSLPGVTPALTIAEAAVVATALLLFVCARPWDRAAGRFALAAGTGVAVVVALAWVRTPATVAILALWGTGVTMSFPPPVYLIALGAIVAALVAFASEPATRHLAVAAALLVVAGVQPTVTQYNLAALLGMAILVLAPEPVPAVMAASEKAAESEAAALESRRILASAGSVTRY